MLQTDDGIADGKLLFWHDNFLVREYYTTNSATAVSETAVSGNAEHRSLHDSVS